MPPAPSSQALAAALDSTVNPQQSDAGHPGAAVAPQHKSGRAGGATCLGEGAASEQESGKALAHSAASAPAWAPPSTNHEQTRDSPCTEPAGGGEAALGGAGAQQPRVQPAAQPASGPPDHVGQAAAASPTAAAGQRACPVCLGILQVCICTLGSMATASARCCLLGCSVTIQLMHASRR